MDIVKKYNKLKPNNRFSSFDVKIKTHVPSPTEVDYQQGYIDRYFIRKYNDRSSFVFEVNKTEYSKYRSDVVYSAIIVRWRLTGTRSEIMNSNSKSLGLAAEEIQNIRSYLPNLLQFAKPTD